MAASLGQGRPFPLVNKQAARLVQGRHTEVLVTSFADKILIAVTHFGRVGSILQAQMDQRPMGYSGAGLGSEDSEAPATASTQFLLGVGSPASKKTQLYQVYSSHFAQMIAHQNPQETRPVVLALALAIEEPDPNVSQPSGQERELDRELFEQVVEMVNECCVWI
ncbi:hypothetical protein BGW38_000801 [Lunasporangiospora selenospora]|uniref:Proteasome assembly chaperone 3 n=1 Tax=Lunasporangiospora selenospora TaxID=979761 RepID=A0A9P6FUL9_9FUNG|nr:hypothetical protein BGW38_000801 [Lunasporangiospora selenospora]